MRTLEPAEIDVAIGGKADIDRPPARVASVAIDPERT
jgi:hypothetical protein